MVFSSKELQALKKERIPFTFHLLWFLMCIVLGLCYLAFTLGEEKKAFVIQHMSPLQYR